MLRASWHLFLVSALSFLLTSCGGGGGGGSSDGTGTSSSGTSVGLTSMGSTLLNHSDDNPPPAGSGDDGTQTAYLVDAAVSGVTYTSRSKSGTTASNGAFNYINGEALTFSIGALTLGSVTSINGDTQVTPQDLAGVKREDTGDARVVLIARFLQSLDSDNDPDNGITIPAAAASKLTTALDLSSDSISETQFDTLVKKAAGRSPVSATSAIAHLRETLGLDNTAPLALTDGITAYASLTLEGSLAGLDAESDPLIYTQLTSPKQGAFTLKSDGTFIYTPPSTAVGEESFSYRVNDGKASSGTKYVTVTIKPLPLSTNAFLFKNLNEDSAFTFSKEDFTAVPDAASVMIDTLPSKGALAFNGITVTSGSGVTLEGLSDLQYTPEADRNGSDSFTLSLYDSGKKKLKTYTVLLSINAINDLPLLTNQTTLEVKSGTPYVATLTSKDQDGDKVTYTLIGGEDKDRFTLSDDRLSFKSAPNYSAPSDSNKDNAYLVTVQSSDGRGTTTQALQINVATTGGSTVQTSSSSPKALSTAGSSAAALSGTQTSTAATTSGSTANQAPVPTFTALRTLEDGTYVSKLSGTDAEGNTLTFIKASDPSKGTLSLSSNGSFTYTPNSDLYGSDSFYYKINDGTVDSKIQGVSITIDGIEDIPTADSFTYGTSVGSTPQTINWRGQSGVTDSTATATVIQQGTKGTASVNGNDVIYTPNGTSSGTDSFYLKITSGDGSNIIEITVEGIEPQNVPTVTAINPPNGSTIAPYTRQPITITFSEAMDAATLTTSTIQLSNGGACSSIDYNATTLTASCYLYDLNNTDTALKGDSSYTITVTTGAQSTTGASLDTQTTSGFTTHPQNLLPRLRTGQVSCYDSTTPSNPLACNDPNALHDDGWYAFNEGLGLARTFERNATSMIVTDKVTGMMWQDDAGVANNTMNQTTAESNCSALSMGGYSDWRLPEIEVLNSILNFNVFNPTRFSDFNYAGSDYWSSTAHIPGATNAWDVSFYSGYDYPYNKTNSAYVRCVQGGQFTPPVFVRDDSTETVLDTTSGLLWQDNDAAISYDGDWSSAMGQCDSLFLGGYTDWRLPNINELRSMVDYAVDNPAASSVFQNVNASNYWSSTTYADGQTAAWYVDFTEGYSGDFTKTSFANVRCVRGGQTPQPTTFYLADNGMTVKCENAVVGSTGVVNGTTYTAVDDTAIRNVSDANYSTLCTTHVTDMSSLFDSNATFNQPIGSWDTGSVTTMSSMFASAADFNQSIGDWNTSNVTTMENMFEYASTFDQPIGNWDVSSVASMYRIFYYATAFNQPIGDWNTSSVIDMEGMFYNATAFNQPVGNWDVSHVRDMYNMFNNASAFNQPIGNWNTGNVTDMVSVFSGASAFNQPIGNWDTGSVINMNYMFANATAFNQPLGDWNTSSVTNMTGMFSNASAFDQNISTWCVTNISSLPTGFDTGSGFVGQTAIQPQWGTCPVRPDFYLSANGVTVRCENAAVGTSGDVNGTTYTAVDNSTLVAMEVGTDDYTAVCTTHVTDMNNLFRSAVTFNEDISSWDTRNVTDMNHMFFNTAFDQNIGNWNTRNVTTMSSMFASATAFNQPIGNWNTRNVTDMGSMFYYASAFNQPIGNWNTGSVINMGTMFYYAVAFDQNISGWDVCNVTNYTDFNTSSPLAPANMPLFGTCP